MTPDNPSQRGWAASKIREYQWKPLDILFDYIAMVEDSNVSYVNELIDYVKGVVDSEGLLKKIEDETARAISAENTLTEITEGLGERISSLENDFESLRKIDSGNVEAFECNEAQKKGDFFIVEEGNGDDDTDTPKVTTLEAKMLFKVVTDNSSSPLPNKRTSNPTGVILDSVSSEYLKNHPSIKSGWLAENYDDPGLIILPSGSGKLLRLDGSDDEDTTKKSLLIL